MSESDIFAAALRRMEARRDHWDAEKEKAIMIGNLTNAAGFQCRAAGVCDAIAILAVAMEDHRQKELDHAT